MILSDIDIRRSVDRAAGIGIEPFDPERVQPNSYDVKLGTNFRFYEEDSYSPHLFGKRVIDPYEDNSHLFQEMELSEAMPFELGAWRFALGRTVETVRLPGDIAGRLEGKSSLARYGIMIHVTGGFVDAGFEGTLTLELFNLSPYTFLLWPGMDIATLAFHRLESHSRLPYGPERGSKYAGQVDATPSRYHENKRG